jgi:hypothetical protein
VSVLEKMTFSFVFTHFNIDDNSIRTTLVEAAKEQLRAKIGSKNYNLKIFKEKDQVTCYINSDIGLTYENDQYLQKKINQIINVEFHYDTYEDREGVLRLSAFNNLKELLVSIFKFKANLDSIYISLVSTNNYKTIDYRFDPAVDASFVCKQNGIFFEQISIDHFRDSREKRYNYNLNTLALLFDKSILRQNDPMINIHRFLDQIFSVLYGLYGIRFGTQYEHMHTEMFEYGENNEKDVNDLKNAIKIYESNKTYFTYLQNMMNKDMDIVRILTIILGNLDYLYTSASEDRNKLTNKILQYVGGRAYQDFAYANYQSEPEIPF